VGGGKNGEPQLNPEPDPPPPKPPPEDTLGGLTIIPGATPVPKFLIRNCTPAGAHVKVAHVSPFVMVTVSLYRHPGTTLLTSFLIKLFVYRSPGVVGLHAWQNHVP